MSQNIVEIKQNDSISKDGFSKKEVISDRNVTYPKESSGTKKIDLISLLLFLIVTLFISCVYLLLSNNSKISHNIDILSNEKHKDKNSIRSLMHKAIPSPKPNPMVGYERNVLLVTNYEPKKGKTSPDVLYNILKGIKKIDLTILNAYDEKINEKGINYLKNFHLVVTDFCDGGYNLASRTPNFARALMQYIKEGGALFTTHDQFDETHFRYITPLAVEILHLLGFVNLDYWAGPRGNFAYFEKTTINNTFFAASHAIYGDKIPISYTHQTYSKFNEACTTCKVIMKFTPSGPNTDEYLVINRPGKGKTLNIRAGHSYAFTEEEKQIFLSSILWLLYEV